MSSATAVRASCACIEPLEDRLLFSSPEQFKLLSLLGYNLKGASYTYKTTTNITTFADGQSQTTASVSAKTTVAVSPTKQVLDGRSSYIVKTTSTGDALGGTSGWASDATGTYSTATSASKDGVGLSVGLKGTRVAAQTVVVGQSYSDTGTFKGTFGGEGLGEMISGSFSGSASVNAKLFGREACTVGSKTYAYAVKGTIVIGLNGTIQMSVDGESIAIGMKAAKTFTFWAVPNKGVVKSTDQLVLNVSVTEQGTTQTAKITVISKAGLVSYVLPA
jgi:hypothetical protein